MSSADLDAAVATAVRMLNNNLHCGETLYCARGTQKSLKKTGGEI